MQVADGLHGAQADGSRLAAVGVPRLCRRGTLGPSHAVCREQSPRVSVGSACPAHPCRDQNPLGGDPSFDTSPVLCRGGQPMPVFPWHSPAAAGKQALAVPPPPPALTLSSEQLAGTWWPRSQSLISGAGIWPWLGGRNVPTPGPGSPGTVGLAGAPQGQLGAGGQGQDGASSGQRHGLACPVGTLLMLCSWAHGWRCGVRAVSGGPGAHCPGGHSPHASKEVFGEQTWLHRPLRKWPCPRCGRGKGFFSGRLRVFLSSGQGPGAVPTAEQGRVAPCPLPIPPGANGVLQGSAAPCRCHRGGACCRQGWQASVLGTLGWCPGYPQTLPRAVPLAGGCPVGTPITPAAAPLQLGGHSRACRFDARGSANQLPAPSPNPAPCARSPPRPPFFPWVGISAHSPYSGGQRLAAASIPTPWLCATLSPPGCQGPCQPPARSPAYLLQPPWAWLPAPGRRERAARRCGAPGSWALGSQCANCAA